MNRFARKMRLRIQDKKRLTARLRWLTLALCLFCVVAQAQEVKLQPGKPIEWQSPYYWAAFTLQGEWR